MRMMDVTTSLAHHYGGRDTGRTTRGQKKGAREVAILRGHVHKQSSVHGFSACV